MCRWVASDGTSVVSYNSPTGYGFSDVAFNPVNPNLLLTTDTEGMFRTWDIGTVVSAASITYSTNLDGEMKWSPDNTLLAFCSPDILLFYPDATVFIDLTGILSGNYLAWSPDSSLLAVSDPDSSDPRISIYNVSAGELVTILDSSTGHTEVQRIQFNNNGYI